MNRSENIRAAAYARVSTLLGQDPENQLVGIRQLAAARGFGITQEYVDKGISGARERRPSLDVMVRDARLGRFKVLIVSALDRLARDTRHLLNLLHELEGYGVSVISIRENLDFTTPIGRAALAILGAISALEREIIRERIRTALAAKKLAAQQTGSGWRCGRRPVITDDLTRKVLELRASGVSVRQVAKAVGVAKSTVQRIIKSVPTTPAKSGGANA